MSSLNEGRRGPGATLVANMEEGDDKDVGEKSIRMVVRTRWLT